LNATPLQFYNKLILKNNFLFLQTISNSKTARILEYYNLLAIPIYFFYNIKHMNKINIQNRNKKLFVASIAIVVALALFVSPMLNVDDALATHNKKNKAKQSIDQSQSSNQNAGCVSGGTTFLSCNNLSFQHQKNSGSNALAQGGQGGNSAEQSISQSQSSSQNSQVVSGADTIGSGNNINVQSQENTGGNALAQG
jgi:hypothetical protein